MTEQADLSGKTALITGATSGHGLAVASSLAGMGAHCIILGRNSEKCMSVKEHITKKTGNEPRTLICDLSSFSSIRNTAREFLSWNIPLHILVNNAGLVNRHFLETEDGIEETMAVNYYAVFLLTMLLLDCIKESAPARIINVSSDMHRLATLDLNNPEARNKKYSFMAAYGRSKLALVYFTLELSRRLSGTGVTVNAVDPGPVASGIANKPGIIPSIAHALIQLTFPSPDKASRTAVYLASSPDLSGTSGRYFRFMHQKQPKINSSDTNFSSRLWDHSVKKTGLA